MIDETGHQPLRHRPELMPGAAFDELLGLLDILDIPRAPARPDDSTELDSMGLEAAVDRAVSTSVAALAKPAETEPHQATLGELLPLPESERSKRLCDPAVNCLAFCRHLIRAARRRAQEELEVGNELAELAVLAATNLDPGLIGKAVHHDVLAEAWATVGSLRRTSLRLEGSRRAFECAERWLQQGSGCLLTRAEVQAQRASLDRDLQDFEIAARRLDEAITVYRAAGVAGPLSRVLVNRGMLRFEQGAPAAASGDLEEALELLAGDESSAQALAAHANLAHCYCQLERFREGWQQLGRARRIAVRLQADLAGVRLQWLEARLFQGDGRPALAEAAFEAALDAFLDRELWGDAAILGIDLAVLYGEQGRRRELRRLVRVMGPILEAKNVRRTALSALLVLARAVEQDAVTVGLLHELREQVAPARL